MNKTLDMTITISAAATPSLYRTLTSIPNPRHRAAFLKRIADEYLRGESANPNTAGGSMQEPATFQIPESHLRDSSAAPARENSRIAGPMVTAGLLAANNDNDHYDFLESSLSGYQYQ
jgi:hypothetical protein